MNSRKFKTIILAIAVFLFGYFYEYLSTYILNMNFCLGVVLVSFLLITIYCFRLKDKLRDARREYGNYYELQNSINKFLIETKKTKEDLLEIHNNVNAIYSLLIKKH